MRLRAQRLRLVGGEAIDLDDHESSADERAATLERYAVELLDRRRPADEDREAQAG